MAPRHIKVKDYGTAAFGIEITGDRKQPEPSTCLIFVPGGRIEITSTTTGNYWVHVSAFTTGQGEVDCYGARLDGRRKGTITEGLYNANGISPACGVGSMQENFIPNPGTYCMKVLIEPEQD